MAITAFTYIYARTTLTGEVGRLVKSFVMYCLSDEVKPWFQTFIFPALRRDEKSMIIASELKVALTAWTFELASDHASDCRYGRRRIFW